MNFAPVDLFSILMQFISVGALLKISFNTGKVSERLSSMEGVKRDHEIRLREVEDLEIRLVTVEKNKADIASIAKIEARVQLIEKGLNF
tara:strand:+ start:20772 stop:21038 length:267 start_codon:yes stop_codon:yes gene_type:complete